MMLALGFSYITLIVLYNVPSMPILLKVFSMTWYWTLSNGFSASTEMIQLSL